MFRQCSSLHNLDGVKLRRIGRDFIFIERCALCLDDAFITHAENGIAVMHGDRPGDPVNTARQVNGLFCRQRIIDRLRIIIYAITDRAVILRTGNLAGSQILPELCLFTL